MKKTIYLLPLAAAVFAMSSCLDKDDSGRHEVAISYPSVGSVLFADQTVDSVLFLTFDSYEVKSYQSSWIKVKSSQTYPSSATITNSYFNYYLCRVDLDLEPNTTSDCRYGYVNVRSYCNDWSQTVTALYYQLSWHNIAYPVASYTRDPEGNAIAAKYTQTDSALQVVDTLRFVAYDKWKLSTSEDSYITLPQTSGEAGSHTLVLSMPVNDSSKSRQTELTLKSENGATTVVTYTQEGKK